MSHRCPACLGTGRQTLPLANNAGLLVQPCLGCLGTGAIAADPVPAAPVGAGQDPLISKWSLWLLDSVSKRLARQFRRGPLSKWLVGFLLAAFAVGAGYLAAHLGSDHAAWAAGTLVGGVSLAVCFVAARGQHFMLSRRNWFLTGYIALVAAVWCAFGLMNTQTAVWAENATNGVVAVELNGRPWLILAPGENVRTRLPQGVHELTVRSQETGMQLERRGIAVKRTNAYVLNVLGAQTYYCGIVRYGYSSELNVELPIKEDWFEAKVDYLFEEPPDSVPVPKGTTSTTRSYLSRRPRLRSL